MYWRRWSCQDRDMQSHLVLTNIHMSCDDERHGMHCALDDGLERYQYAGRTHYLLLRNISDLL